MPAYPVLFAAGAVALERVVAMRGGGLRVAARTVVVLALLANAVLIARAFLPIYTPGSARFNAQVAHSSDLADEIGWPELVAQVAAVRDTLTPQERRSLGVLGEQLWRGGSGSTLRAAIRAAGADQQHEYLSPSGLWTV